jgi:hypothetical protein
VRIVLFVEGETERACAPVLKRLLDDIAAAESRAKVHLDVRALKGTRILDGERVAEDAKGYLVRPDVLGVAVLVDVRPEFGSAEEAMGAYTSRFRDTRFRAHCALHDFEAWLLPYWERVFREAKRPAPKRCPWPSPEVVNLAKPPSRVLSEDVFTGKPAYRKTVHAPRILEGQDLRVAAEACPQLRAFLNTLLEFAGYDARL